MSVRAAVQDEAEYLSENFGISYEVAVQVSVANAKKAARKKKRVDR